MNNSQIRPIAELLNNWAENNSDKKRAFFLVCLEEEKDGIQVDGCITGPENTIVKGIAAICDDKKNEIGHIIRKGMLRASLRKLLKL